MIDRTLHNDPTLAEITQPQFEKGSYLIGILTFTQQFFGVKSIVYVTVKSKRKLSGVDDPTCVAMEEKEKPE